MKTKPSALVVGLPDLALLSSESHATTFFFVRHGRTAYNVEGRMQGQADIPLDDTGKAQAHDVGLKLAAYPFDACISSDLSRTYETAAIIMQNHQNPLPIITDIRLRERDARNWEGKLFCEFQAASDYEQANMEADEDIYARVVSCLEELAAKYPAKTILIVTHGGVMCTILSKITQQSYSLKTHHTIQNGAVLSAHFSQGSWSPIAMEGITLPSL